MRTFYGRVNIFTGKYWINWTGDVSASSARTAVKHAVEIAMGRFKTNHHRTRVERIVTDISVRKADRRIEEIEHDE